MQDELSVNLVKSSWRACVRERFGRMPVPPDSESISGSCIQFFKLVAQTGVGLKDLMEASMDSLSEDWCREKFRTPWPPLSVAVGPGRRKYLRKSYPPVKSAGRTGKVPEEAGRVFDKEELAVLEELRCLRRKKRERSKPR